MKKLTHRRLQWLLSLTVAILVCLCLFVGCTVESDITETDGQATTGAVTAAGTEVQTSENTQAQETDPETTEALTEELKGWEQDTGKFNDGVVDYELLVETQIHAAYPDEKLGQLMEPGAAGVINTFHADFEDNDPTCGGEASVRSAGATDCRDGVLYGAARFSFGRYALKGCFFPHISFA